MVAPIAAFVGKSLASLGLWKAGSGALSKIAPAARKQINKLGGWIKGNPKNASIIGGIGIGGYSLSGFLESLGIKDKQLQTVTIIGLLLAAVAALGQLFDINLGGN